ncbi:hypothetical protein PsorP6_001266 [Peronosclerospora sorghi]|uniref:Uncharacterized protein n=1 Tax=Peronosclerospora sorghi TaxID=230839 RepID=A0ACC0WRC0_9STRA|nr:hypothetical protein PsorP6_001266 [Peronosclerospora sorghi]
MFQKTERTQIADAGKMPLSSNIESDTIPSSPSAPISVSKTVTSPTGLSKSPQAPSESPASLSQTPFEAHQVTPLSRSAASNIQLETDDAKISAHTTEEESLYGSGTFEVVISSSKFCWQIGNVFCRAVVQYVQPSGPAALAGIQKSDVLLVFRDIVLNEENCTAVVQQLSKERVVVPSALRFRRALDPHSQSNTVIKENGLPKASSVSDTAKVSPHESDGDVEMTNVEVAPTDDPVERKYGLQVLCHPIGAMQDAVAGSSAVEIKALIDLLLNSEFSLRRAALKGAHNVVD